MSLLETNAHAGLNSGKPIETPELIDVFKRLAHHWRQVKESNDAKRGKGIVITEAEDHEEFDHPIEYLFELIEERTGIACDTLCEAAWRINTDFGLAGYTLHQGQKRQDLRWILPELNKLDGVGSTARIVQKLWSYCQQCGLETEAFALQEGLQRTTKKRSESRRELRDRAKQYVKRNGYPGLNALSKSLSCPPSSLSNAIRGSAYLKELKAKHERNQTGKPREILLNSVLRDDLSQQTERDPADEAALNELIEEQTAEREAEVRQNVRRGCSRSRS